MNHPNVDDLMRVEDSVEVTVRGKKRKFYLRTLGQRDEDARRDHAVSASRAMYRKLADDKSDEYVKFIAPLASMARADQESNLVMLKIRELRQEAELEIVVPDTKEAGEHPTVVDIVEAEEERDKAEAEVVTMRRDRVRENQEKFKEDVKEWEDQRVLDELRRLTIDAACNNEFSRAFNDATVFFGTWKEGKYRQRLFANIGDAENCDPKLYSQLLTSYYELDTFSADVDALKNLPSDQPPST